MDLARVQSRVCANHLEGQEEIHLRFCGRRRALELQHLARVRLGLLFPLGARARTEGDAEAVEDDHVDQEDAEGLVSFVESQWPRGRVLVR